MLIRIKHSCFAIPHNACRAVAFEPRKMAATTCRRDQYRVTLTAEL